MFREDFDENNKIVKQEYINFNSEEYFVSTVDLGLDYSFGRGEPLYYETMIFPKGEWGEMYCMRYPNREMALKSHEALVYNINHGNYVINDGYFELK